MPDEATWRNNFWWGLENETCASNDTVIESSCEDSLASFVPLLIATVILKTKNLVSHTAKRPHKNPTMEKIMHSTHGKPRILFNARWLKTLLATHHNFFQASPGCLPCSTHGSGTKRFSFCSMSSPLIAVFMFIMSKVAFWDRYINILVASIEGSRSKRSIRHRDFSMWHEQMLQFDPSAIDGQQCINVTKQPRLEIWQHAHTIGLVPCFKTLLFGEERVIRKLHDVWRLKVTGWRVQLSISLSFFRKSFNRQSSDGKWDQYNSNTQC